MLRRLSTYLITGSWEEDVLLRRVERALAAGVDFVQLRRKEDSARKLERLASRLRAFAEGSRGKVLVNDRLDVALSSGLDGVHLPADGLPVEAVRRAAPPSFLVARSTHDRSEAERAAREGASFIVFGPVFETSSKPGRPGAGLEALAEVVASVSIPVFALGGVNPSSVAGIARAGAAGVAGISVFEEEESLRALMESVEASSEIGSP